MSDTDRIHDDQARPQTPTGQGAALPMPHGADDDPPAPSGAGALPIPHGTDDVPVADTPAMPMPHEADDTPPAPTGGGALPMPHDEAADRQPPAPPD